MTDEAAELAQFTRRPVPWWCFWLALGFMLGVGAGVLVGASSTQPACPPVRVTWPPELTPDRPIPLRIVPDIAL